MTLASVILELSPLSTGTVIEHLLAADGFIKSGGTTIVTKRVSDAYEIEYVPTEEEQIHYKVSVEVIEYLKDGTVSIAYVPQSIVEISLLENLIVVEMLPAAQIEVTYEPDTDNN